MIRKATCEDFDFIFHLYMHPTINPFLLYEKMEAPAFKIIFDELLEAGVLYIFESGPQPVGMFKLMPLKHRNSHIVYLGGLAIHPSFSGKGFGQKMMEAIIALAKEMNFLRIELSTATHNTAAIKLYEKSGFVKEGILKNYTFLQQENRYVDEVMMAYLY